MSALQSLQILYRLRVNYQVPSKPTVINNIGGLVVLPISSGKWLGKSLQTRFVFLVLTSQGINMSLSCYNCHLHMMQEVSIWKKHHLLYSFFFVRRVIAPLVTFLFYCVVIPLSAMVPGVSIPVWGLVYIPTAITCMNAIRNPGYA